jgi:hypothetical protein
VASDPEELLRSIERTREELASTVDTIADRLDPKRVAKRGVDAVRGGVTGVVDGTRSKLHHGLEAIDHRDRGTSDPADGRRGLASKVSKVGPMVSRLPAPAKGAGLAALVALAAILTARRRRR